MAISKKIVASENIKVVAFIDDCVTVDRETYETYLENLNEELLELEGEPTRFILKTVLTYDQQTKLDSKVSISKETKNAVIAGQSLQEIRLALVGIEAPQSQDLENRLEFKKDSDGLASKELIAALASCEIVGDLLGALRYARTGTKHLQKK